MLPVLLHPQHLGHRDAGGFVEHAGGVDDTLLSMMIHILAVIVSWARLTEKRVSLAHETIAVNCSSHEAVLPET